MNNLFLTKEKIKRAESFYAAHFAATKNGKLISHRPYVFEERYKQTREEVAAMDS
tara:strand:- start:767 stop:931 length:165 start_codon:yes stop_codon:yes gene_type:complete